MELSIKNINQGKRVIYLILIGLLLTGLFSTIIYFAKSTTITVLESKSGQQNLWDDELSPLEPQALKDLWDEAQLLGNSELLNKIKKERKRRGRKIDKNADWGGKVK